jgi:hypothetical protein
MIPGTNSTAVNNLYQFIVPGGKGLLYHTLFSSLPLCFPHTSALCWDHQVMHQSPPGFLCKLAPWFLDKGEPCSSFTICSGHRMGTDLKIQHKATKMERLSRDQWWFFHIMCFFYFSLFWGRISLCIPDWPWTLHPPAWVSSEL